MSTVDYRSVFNELSSAKKEINKLILKLEKRIKTAPNGTLRIARKRKGFQYYQKINVNDTKGIYIPRKEKKLAVSLAQKDYDTKLLEVLKQQYKTIERFVDGYDPGAAQQVYEKLTEARKLLVHPEFLTDEEFINQWMSTPYTRPPFKEILEQKYTATTPEPPEES